jgi:plasmid stabilization system protein ParE
VTYALHRSAEGDLLQAAQFYRQEAGHKLANRFLDEFERIVKLVMDFPGLGTPVDEVRRLYPLRDFPYSVIHREVQGQIRVLAVRAHHRDPEYGLERS